MLRPSRDRLRVPSQLGAFLLFLCTKVNQLRWRFHCMDTCRLVTEHRPENILDLVNALLQEKLSWDVNRVSYQYENGMLVLRGTLSSFYQKQLAQEAVRNLEGVRQIRNEIQVVHPCSAA
jgi:osmotically-inducible protein OsmY